MADEDAMGAPADAEAEGGGDGLFKAGVLVYVKLNGRLGIVLGPSENPQFENSDERVLKVRMNDDSSVIESTESGLAEAYVEPLGEGEEPAAAPEPAPDTAGEVELDASAAEEDAAEEAEESPEEEAAEDAAPDAPSRKRPRR